MEREHLGSFGRAVRAQRLEPLGGAPMDLDLAETRDLPVRLVADEGMAEPVLMLTLD